MSSFPSSCLLHTQSWRFGKISPETQAWKDPRVRVAIRRSIDFKSIGAFLANKVEFERNGIDALGDAQRKELDVGKRNEILKDFQRLLAELMPAVPGRHLYTNFDFRWPWLHNLAYGTPGSPPSGMPILGGHLHWLDQNMPGRNTGAS